MLAPVQYSRGVAVVADSYWNAKKAKDLLVVNDAGPNAGLNMTNMWEGFEEQLLSLVLYLEKSVMLMLECLTYQNTRS